jgi:protein-tyrosine phosphatase
LGKYAWLNNPTAIRDAVASLQNVLITRGIPLRILPGADIRVRENLPELVASGHVMTLADQGKWILLELPGECFLEIAALIGDLKNRGIRIILTHPERYQWSDAEISRALTWRRNFGLLMQITAGSLFGHFGPRAKRLGWQWLETGIADIVASDAHDCLTRAPFLRDAYDAICRRGGETLAKRVMCDTPARIIAAPDGPDLAAHARALGEVADETL